MRTASQLRKTRTIKTPLGRKRTFFNRWDASLLKEAYAYVPQSTVADLLNIGLRNIYERYHQEKVEILLQIHDAVLLQVPTEMVCEELFKEIKELMSIPVMIGSRELIIPVDISVGDSWDGLRKWE